MNFIYFRKLFPTLIINYLCLTDLTLMYYGFVKLLIKTKDTVFR